MAFIPLTSSFRLTSRASSDPLDSYACFGCTPSSQSARPLTAARLLGPELNFGDEAAADAEMGSFCFTFWRYMRADVATKGKIGELRVSLSAFSRAARRRRSLAV